MVIDFLSTLFVTFCIGVATALALAACVMLMAAEAHGAAPGKPHTVQAGATTADLVLAHYFAARYAGLVAVDRIYPAGPLPRSGSSDRPKGCKG
jgi:hypothetical protein